MENNTYTIENLLSQVSLISHKYDEITYATGEKFNIFSVLKLESDEVRLHSRLIGELLNPKGNHGQEELFLKLFIKSIGLQDEYSDKDLTNAKIIIEENIGNISDDYTKGGRIDLVVKFLNNPREIVIENKIYATDQKNQLGRYFKQYPNSHLFYLTLLEKTPSIESLGEYLKSEQVNCITYKTTIKEWLELCHEKASNYPLVREILKQYINLINKLTHQTMDEKMKLELVETIVKNDGYIKAAEEISNIWESCKFQIIKNLEPEIKKIAGDLGLKVLIDDQLGNVDTGFWFFKDEWDYCILFYFESKFDSILIGIDNLENDKKCSEYNVVKIKKALEDFENSSTKKYDNWIWVSNFDEWKATEWNQVLDLIPEKIKISTKRILDKLIDM